MTGPGSTCPICEVDCSIQVQPMPGRAGCAHWVDCPRCGEFGIVEGAAIGLGQGARGRLSGFVKRRVIHPRPRPFIWKTRPDLTPEEKQAGHYSDSFSIRDILDSTPATVSDKQDELLVALSEITDPGQPHEMTEMETSLAYTVSRSESLFHLNQLRQAGLLERAGSHASLLTTKGWNRAEELKRGGVADPRRAFVAMWFAQEMTPIYETAIAPAIREAGYEPRQVAFIEHNDDINDLILAEIRKARFLVADFTGGRAGVYFEAGFALGLGKTVISTCRHDWLEKLHFDTRNRSHIDWEDSEDLQRRLRNRIEATVPPL